MTQSLTGGEVQLLKDLIFPRVPLMVIGGIDICYR